MLLIWVMLMVRIFIINNNTLDCHRGGSAMPRFTSSDEDDDDEVVVIKFIIMMLMRLLVLVLFSVDYEKNKGWKSQPPSHLISRLKLLLKIPANTPAE